MGHVIPKDTTLLLSHVSCRHEEAFWGDPEEFRPQKFLDSEGNLLAADDSKRKHVMPFAMGMRLCRAEQLSQARLFLWLTNLLKRFIIRPRPENDVHHTKVEEFEEKLMTYARKYTVIIEQRQ